MSCTTLTAISRSIDSFPALPSTASKVLKVTNDPESSARDMMEAILPDQAMCVAILKVANSAFFGQPREVSSLEKAVMVLGFNEIQSIVLGKAVFDIFRHISGFKEDMDRFWNHSFNCGLTAKVIAQSLYLPQGSFFIGGLIHDIGKLALFMTFPNDYPPPLWLATFPTPLMEKNERMVFALNHEQVAGRLLKRWFFPSPLIQAIEFHHAPEMSPGITAHALILSVADSMTYFRTCASSMDAATIDQYMAKIYPDLQSIWLSAGLPWMDDMLHNWHEQVNREHHTNGILMNLFSS